MRVSIPGVVGNALRCFSFGEEGAVALLLILAVCSPSARGQWESVSDMRVTVVDSSGARVAGDSLRIGSSPALGTNAATYPLDFTYSLQAGEVYSFWLEAANLASTWDVATSGSRATFDVSVPLMGATNLGGNHRTFARAATLVQPFVIHDESSGMGLPAQRTQFAQLGGGGWHALGSVNATSSESGGLVRFTGVLQSDAAQPEPGVNLTVRSDAQSFVFFGFDFSSASATTIRVFGELSATGRGASQAFPRLPNSNSGGAQRFVNVPSGEFYDPPMASGFLFEMTGSSLFTNILGFPVGIDGDGLFQVRADNTLLGTFAQNQGVDFIPLLGHGVSSFEVSGIDPLVDGGDPEAFPIQLAFNTPTADFTMTAVPEPSLLGGLCLVLLTLCRRRSARAGL